MEQTPAEKTVQGSDVVAAGAGPQFLQLPSPIYVAEWITPTHVLIGAGGGGSRFGMANVLVMLAIHTGASERQDRRPPSTAAASAAPVRLTAAQQSAVSAASARTAAKGKSGESNDGGGTGSEGVARSANEGGLWRFVAALDLGKHVPWCTSHFLPWSADQEGDGNNDEARDGERMQFVFSQKQRDALRSVHGFLALSSITSFSLVAVERRQSTAGVGESSLAYSLRMLACVVVPNDPFNPDKKPIALVHNAVVVAHDAKGILLYDLTQLVPEDVDGSAPSTITEVSPLAAWTLPARVNDLHANRVNLTQAKLSSRRHTQGDKPNGSGPGIAPATAVKALLLDFVVVAAAVQDRTVRLASFRLRRDYGAMPPTPPPAPPPSPPPVPSATAAPGGARKPPEERIDNAVTAPFAFLPGNVLQAADFALPFQPLPSSFRLVRLFGLENLAPWPGAMESARRRATNSSLAATTAVATMSSPPPLSLLPAVSLLLVAYDQQGNQSYFVSLLLNTAVAAAATVPWRWQESCRPAAPSTAAVAAPPGKTDKRMKEQPVLTFHPVAYGGPSPVARDCVTCLAVAHAHSCTVEGRDLQRRNPFGAAIPLRWIAGTVDGWLVQVSGREDAEGKHVEFAGDMTRPVTAPAWLKKKYPPLHKEPITAVAVSSQNDVLSTDLAQNAAISTLPFALLPTKVDEGTGSQHSHAHAALMKEKLAGLQLFPPPASGSAGGVMAHLGSLFLLGEPGKAVSLVFACAVLLLLLAFLLAG